MGNSGRVRSAALWSGLGLAGWLLVTGGCGSRNSLQSSLFEGASGGATHGANNITSTGVSTSTADTFGSSTATATTTGTFTTTPGFTGMTAVTTGTGTTGFGGSPACMLPENVAGQAGQGGQGGETSTHEPCAVPFCDLWAPAYANCAGIQGGFYSFSDQSSGAGSTIYIDPVSTGGSRICVSGVIGQVFDQQYDVYWGAGFGLNLNQLDENGPADPYDIEDHRVVGFGFRISQLPPGGQLRFALVGSDIYCETIAQPGYTDYRLDDLIKGCWDPDPTPHDYSDIRAIEWHIVANETSAYTYGFCLDELTVYPGAD